MELSVDLDNNNFKLLGEPYFYGADLYVRIYGKYARVNPDSILFSYTLKNNNSVVFSSSFQNVKVLSKWNGVSFVDRIQDLIPNTQYVVDFSIFSDHNFSFSFKIKTPYPPKEYESWVWDESNLSWEAPVAYPEDGENYEWDEKIQNWTIVSAEIEEDVEEVEEVVEES